MIGNWFEVQAGQGEHEHPTVIRGDHEPESGVAESERFLDRRRQRDNERDVRGADDVRDEQRRDPSDRSGNEIAFSHRPSAYSRHT